MINLFSQPSKWLNYSYAFSASFTRPPIQKFVGVEANSNGVNTRSGFALNINRKLQHMASQEKIENRFNQLQHEIV